MTDGRLGLTQISAMAATWVGVASAIAGGWLGLQTYRSDVDREADARVVQTFALYDTFNGDGMLAARRAVLDAMGRGAAPDSVDMFVFVDFFDTVEACVARDLCDDDLVQTIFAPYAKGTWPLLQTRVEGTRRAEDGLGLERPFGAGYEWLATGAAPESEG